MTKDFTFIVSSWLSGDAISITITLSGFITRKYDQLKGKPQHNHV